VDDVYGGGRETRKSVLISAKVFHSDIERAPNGSSATRVCGAGVVGKEGL